jgi:adenosylmethionine-8-amino-7-oxononanoate aminotransferase
VHYTHTHKKITKYGVVERLVHKAVSGYICNMDIDTAEGKKLEDTLSSLLNRNIGHNHHSYQDKFYNCVRLVAALLDRSVSVCGTMRG